MLTLTITLDQPNNKVTVHGVEHNATSGEKHVAGDIARGLQDLVGNSPGHFDSDVKVEAPQHCDIDALLARMAA